MQIQKHQLNVLYNELNIQPKENANENSYIVKVFQKELEIEKSFIQRMANLPKYYLRCQKLNLLQPTRNQFYSTTLVTTSQMYKLEVSKSSHVSYWHI